jgi:hypothetical protein
MDQRGDEVHTSETEASGGSKEGVVRWVLIVGLVLAAAFLTIIWVTGALVQDEGADSETNVSTEMAVEEGADEDRGEPIAPAMEGPTPSPDAAATPGDAPAGDPAPDAQ